MPPEGRSYLVCSTPRSGSTLLCELLKSTGVAGYPEEYFEATAATGLPPHPGEYLAGLPRTGAGIRANPDPPHAPVYSDLRGLPSYRAHLERTLHAGRTPNGVFGSKLMWAHLAELQQHTADLSEFADLQGTALLDRLFEQPVYVWMRRTDKVRQAISLWRALQTRAWRRSTADTSADRPDLRYSYDGIRHLVGRLTADDAAWGRMFAASGVTPVLISYEDDLEHNRADTIRRVLAAIGVAPPAQWRPDEPMSRQADAVNDEWYAAYHSQAIA